MTPLLDVRGLQVDLQTSSEPFRVLRDIGFRMGQGEVLALIGESGCGKSMTCLALLDLLPPTARCRADRLFFNDFDLAREPALINKLRGDRIAMVTQDPGTGLHPCLSIGSQLIENFRRRRQATRREAQTRALDLLARVGIEKPRRCLDSFPHQLSGGQRQRVMIAMALMCSPALLIADEPTTALDVVVQAQVLDLLLALRDEMRMGLLLVTHEFGVVARAADRVAVMYAGEIVETGPVAAVLGGPLHPYTSALLRCAAALGQSPADALPTIGGSIPVLGSRGPGCSFEPRCERRIPACAVRVNSVLAAPDHVARCNRPIRAASLDAARIPAKITAATGPILLDAHDLHREFRLRSAPFTAPKKVHAVCGVTLSIRAGEIVGLVGGSGSGKSTLARILMGLDEPTQGQVKIDGKPLAALSRSSLASLIMPVFQNPFSSLNPRQRIGDIVEAPLAVKGVGRAERRRIAAAILERVGLPASAITRFPRQLSGGQRQRVAIARALVLRPRLIVCDEPTSALDVSIQAQILNLLLELQREFGLAYFFISHNLAVVRHVASRILVMHAGRIVEELSPSGFLTEHRHPYTAALIGAMLPLEAVRH